MLDVKNRAAKLPNMASSAKKNIIKEKEGSFVLEKGCVVESVHPDEGCYASTPCCNNLARFNNQIKKRFQRHLG